jgi:uncharacterized protein YoaH (UPF0181 family)
MMARALRKRSQVEIHDRIQDAKATGASTTEAITQVATETGMRAGTVAAAYYREARHRSTTRKPQLTEEVTVTPAATAPAEADAPPEEEPKRIGQLAFDGFAVSAHKLKIAGTTLDISDEVAKALKLGSEIKYTFTARVVKRNNHLLTDDNGSSVEHDVVCIMQDVAQA